MLLFHVVLMGFNGEYVFSSAWGFVFCGFFSQHMQTQDTVSCRVLQNSSYIVDIQRALLFWFAKVLYVLNYP